MNDKPRIIAGLVVALVAADVSVLVRAGSGALPVRRPTWNCPPASPAAWKTRQYMRAHHMDLLDQWRECGGPRRQEDLRLQGLRQELRDESHEDLHGMSYQPARRFATSATTMRTFSHFSPRMRLGRAAKGTRLLGLPRRAEREISDGRVETKLSEEGRLGSAGGRLRFSAPGGCRQGLGGGPGGRGARRQAVGPGDRHPEVPARGGALAPAPRPAIASTTCPRSPMPKKKSSGSGARTTRTPSPTRPIRYTADSLERTSRSWCCATTARTRRASRFAPPRPPGSGRRTAS